MKKVMLIVIAIIGLMVGSQNQTFAQGGKKVAVYGTKKAAGDLSSPSDDAPRAKASKKRGYCYLTLDNFTGYYVDIWVEGQYQGRLSPYATSVRFDIWTPGNWTKWEAWTAGRTYYWSNSSYCNDSRTFTINLKQ